MAWGPVSLWTPWQAPAHPGAGRCASSWLRAPCLCPLPAWNVLPGVSHTIPRATATVRVWVGRGQTSVPRDITGRQGAGGCCVKGGCQARSLIFQETRQVRPENEWPVLKAVTWGALAPCCPALSAGLQAGLLEEPQENIFLSCGVDRILEIARVLRAR